MSLAAHYLDIKHVHLTCVALSVTLFAVRGVWIVGIGGRLWRWLHVVPHIVDTLLLASGLTLAFLIHQYPFVNSGWLTAKVIGLIAYIALGIVVFRGPDSRVERGMAGVSALIVFAYIVSVAISKQPAGFFAG